MNISPLAVVHPEAKIGQNTTVDPFAVIEKDVVIGDNCRIYSHATILDGARIGNNCQVFPGAVIAGIPQDLKQHHSPRMRDRQSRNSLQRQNRCRQQLPDYGLFPYCP